MQLPLKVIEAARTLENWATENNLKGWVVGNVCDISLAVQVGDEYDVKESLFTTEGVHGVAGGEDQR